MIGAVPDTFCILAWTNLMTMPEGVAKVCCWANGLIEDDHGPMRLADHDAEAIWNGAAMREMRRAMLAGEPVAACRSCYEAEAASGNSLRTECLRLDIGGDEAERARLAADSAADGHRVATLPTTLHLNVSNLCNLTCRMCNSSYSSQIAQDPVLARLAPPLFDLPPSRAPARTHARTIGPGAALGVTAAGLAADGALAGRATLALPVAWFEKPMMLHVELATAVPDAILTLGVNGRSLLEQPVALLGRRIDVDISWLEDAEDLTVELAARDGVLGIGWVGLTMLRAPEAVRQAGKVGQRPSANHLPSVAAMIANPDLVQISFTGGEPMLMPEVGEVIDYLVDAGRAPHLGVMMATNATRLDAAMLDQLQGFKALRLYVSLDGVGPVYDYIRPPARWARVEANVRALAARFGRPRVGIQPTVQAYNLLEITDVFRFADALDLELALLAILVGPLQLAIQVMPPAIRAEALARIRRYRAAECRPENHHAVDNLVGNLETTMGDFRAHLLPEFMRFTNQLDRRHGQSFRHVHAELVARLEAAGYPWIDDVPEQPVAVPLPTGERVG
jgi:MoaA/NifB/PqqE/SkfB family radical SAM enzyme